MTDRPRGALRQEERSLAIGASRYDWDGARLTVSLDEPCSLPSLGRVRGTVTIEPEAVTSVELALSPDRAHVWRPFAPVSRIRVALDGQEPWEGKGYLDANFGTRPLEADFSYWTWASYAAPDGALMLYDADRRDGTRLAAAVHVARDGSARMVDAPPKAPLPRSRWRVRRETRADPGAAPRHVASMLDAPFYSRDEVETLIGERRMRGVHESLDLDRYSSAVVKGMLAFRVPRARR